MGNNFCCQPTNDTSQLRIEQIINEEKNFCSQKLTYSRELKSTKSLSKLKQKYNIRKLKKIQSVFKGIYSRKKFNRDLISCTNMLKNDLKLNLVTNIDQILKAHKGEQFSKKVEETIGPYKIPKKINKYSIYSKPAYINKGVNDDIYCGYWGLNKTFSGYGILYKDDGSKFEGIWVDNNLTGEGRYFTNNEEYYIGEFQNGLANGKGTFTHNNGGKYTGNWVDDQPEGEGEEIFEDGSRFKGRYEKGKKVLGKFEWEDGSYYEGEMKNDNFHGKGVYYWKEGRTYSGDWVDGQMDGKGLFTYLDGSYYDGEFHKGLRNGNGKYVWNENKSYEGGWLNGRQHGKGKYIKNDKEVDGIWINGKLKTVLRNTDSLFSKNNTSNNNMSEYTGNFTYENNDITVAKVNKIQT